MRTWKWMFTAALLVSVSAAAQQPAESQPSTQPDAAAATQTLPAPASQPSATESQAQPSTAPVPTPSALPQPTTMDQVVDRFIEREHGLMKALANRTPVVETYLQNLSADPQLGPVPSADHYFLGRMDMGEAVDRKDYLKEQNKGMETRLLGGFNKLFKVQYQPLGFSWMVYADRTDFDRSHYDFHYIRREFLGDVRCLVFDITPKKNSGKGRFQGRVWVEDQDYNIVRLNGTYAPAPKNSYFFHMDSWRLNLIPGYWLPAYIYSEEGDFSAGVKNKMAFKAQTRIWGYDLKKGDKDDELTQIRVDSVKDESAAAQDASPLQAERQWQQQAEDNVIERLTRAGLVAPEGDVDHILQTVVNNLQVTNNIDLPRPVRTRVLLTAPLETFSVGNTIVISRGLIDVLPDEASLAAVLSHELAHIVLGHNLGSKYAFNDRMLFSDDSTYNNLGFKHIPEEETAADKKAVELLEQLALRAETRQRWLVPEGAASPRSSAQCPFDHAPGQFAVGERKHQPPVGAGHARPSARQQQTGPGRGSPVGRTRQGQSVGRQGRNGEDGSGRHHLGAGQDAVRSHALLSAVSTLRRLDYTGHRTGRRRCQLNPRH